MRYIIFFTIIAFFTSCIKEEVAIANSKQDYSLLINEVSTYKLPNELYLFGEKIPLEQDDIRERAEREFYLLLQQLVHLLELQL